MLSAELSAKKGFGCLPGGEGRAGFSLRQDALSQPELQGSERPVGYLLARFQECWSSCSRTPLGEELHVETAKGRIVLRETVREAWDFVREEKLHAGRRGRIWRWGFSSCRRSTSCRRIRLRRRYLSCWQKISPFACSGRRVEAPASCHPSKS